MKKFDTILWDVDDTLLDFAKTERVAITHCYQTYKVPVTDETIMLYSEINKNCWKMLERGEMKKEVLLHHRFELLFKELEMNHVNISDFQMEFQNKLGTICYYLDRSLELCKMLQPDFNQYIVTNGVAVTQRNRLQIAGFDSIMEEIFISEEIGSPKPTNLFFETCFEKIPNCDKSKIIIVGDSLTSDILGGNNSGIKTCWYNRHKIQNNTNAIVDYEIHDLWDVTTILKEQL